MALVERTNSSELYEMRHPYQPISPCRSGGKKSSRKSGILRNSKASSLSLSDDDAASTSSSTSSSRVSFVEDEISETRFYDTMAAARDVSASALVSSSSPSSTPPPPPRCQQPEPLLVVQNATLHFIQSSPVWMGDNTLLNTDVFHKRLNRPAVKIQAMVRGVIQRRKYRQERIIRLRQELYALEYYAVSLIQARVRGIQQRQHYALCRAAMPMQALVRGWICRLKLRVKSLHRRLEMVTMRHARDLQQIEDDKQREMKRIYKDLHEVDAKKQRKQAQQKKKIDAVIDELRNHNIKLRGENETLHKACIVMARKSERTMNLTQALYQNIREVEKTLPQLQYDHDNITRVHRECKQVVQQYETALSMCQENLLGEKKISDFFVHGIENMLQVIEKGRDDGDKKLGESLRKSSSRRIRVALQEQEQSNQMTRGETPATLSTYKLPAPTPTTRRLTNV